MSWNTWSEEVIRDLLELKPSGMSFERAWKEVMGRRPPRGFWPREHAQDNVSWLKRVCKDAWNNDRPALAAFTLDLVA